jgi:two-component system chemotaxis sensor kinase CheA
MRKDEYGASSIRVPTDRLDMLVNLVGELVTVQARLSQTAFLLGAPALDSLAEEVDRLTADLRDTTMKIRMLPFGTTFSKFKRLVRSLSQELQKEVELVTEGAETELDKTLIERLADPLVHVLRNCLDHGIELPAIREAAGKSRQGTIYLSALHAGNHVLITIKDDGVGLDAEVIRAKAIEKGLVAPNAELSDKDLFSLILLPDFSTAKEVTNVSGRGVGMDVVKKAIDALRGTIEINSVRGHGTTITLTLPLTLAIIDGFRTTVGTEQFIFPLAEVEECLELTDQHIEDAGGRRMVQVQGRLVPYVRLRDQFMLGGEQPKIEQIVIAKSGKQRVGFVVDDIVGEHQTVIKSLGRFYQDVEGISGASILGDGSVAFILDVRTLLRSAEQDEIAAKAPCAQCVECLGRVTKGGRYGTYC